MGPMGRVGALFHMSLSLWQEGLAAAVLGLLMLHMHASIVVASSAAMGVWGCGGLWCWWEWEGQWHAPSMLSCMPDGTNALLVV